MNQLFLLPVNWPAAAECRHRGPVRSIGLGLFLRFGSVFIGVSGPVLDLFSGVLLELLATVAQCSSLSRATKVVLRVWTASLVIQ